MARYGYDYTESYSPSHTGSRDNFRKKQLQNFRRRTPMPLASRQVYKSPFNNNQNDCVRNSPLSNSSKKQYQRRRSSSHVVIANESKTCFSILELGSIVNLTFCTLLLFFIVSTLNSTWQTPNIENDLYEKTTHILNRCTTSETSSTETVRELHYVFTKTFGVAQNLSPVDAHKFVKSIEEFYIHEISRSSTFIFTSICDVVSVTDCVQQTLKIYEKNRRRGKAGKMLNYLENELERVLNDMHSILFGYTTKTTKIETLSLQQCGKIWNTRSHLKREISLVNLLHDYIWIHLVGSCLDGGGIVMDIFESLWVTLVNFLH